MSETGADSLRVLHVVRPAAGGMVTHLRLLCGELTGRGVHVEVAAPDGFDIGLPDIRVHLVPIRSRTSPFADLLAARAVSRLGSRADVIHGHGVRGAWIASLAARWAKKPYVFTAHNLAPTSLNLLSRRLLGSVVRRAAKVICVSRVVAESFRAHGLTDSRTVLIPNGIDLRPFDSARPGSAVRAEIGIPGDAPLVVSVGRISEEKGFLVLARAARVVLQEMPDRRPDAWFVLAGDGPQRGMLEEWIGKLEIESRFKLVGRYSDVPALLAASDVVAVPSLQEGQGIVALEAMAARRPVVATCAGGLAETVVPDVTGRLVMIGSPAQLGVSILELLAEPALRQRMGEAGRARVEALYTASRMAEETLEVYRTVRSSTLKNL